MSLNEPEPEPEPEPDELTQAIWGRFRMSMRQPPTWPPSRLPAEPAVYPLLTLDMLVEAYGPEFAGAVDVLRQCVSRYQLGEWCIDPRYARWAAWLVEHGRISEWIQP
jgi:hypothetical protein